jgi:hypothetical protein
VNSRKKTSIGCPSLDRPVFDRDETDTRPPVSYHFAVDIAFVPVDQGYRHDLDVILQNGSG